MSSIAEVRYGQLLMCIALLIFCCVASYMNINLISENETLKQDATKLADAFIKYKEASMPKEYCYPLEELTIDK